MTYKGQVIYQFDASRNDEFFTNQAEQMINISRFIMIFLIGGAVIALITQIDTVEFIDIGIFVVFVIFIFFLYRALTQRITTLRDPELLEMEETLIIYEYGIEFPPLTNSSIDPIDLEYSSTGHHYSLYNEIESIEIDEDQITITTSDNVFIIDLVYFPFYSAEEDNYHDQVELLLELFNKIMQNLEKVENRDHPTIIPKAYFRKTLDKYT